MITAGVDACVDQHTPMQPCLSAMKGSGDRRDIRDSYNMALSSQYHTSDYNTNPIHTSQLNARAKFSNIEHLLEQQNKLTILI